MFIYCISCVLAGYTQYGNSFEQFSIGIVVWFLTSVSAFWWGTVVVLDRKGGLWELATRIAGVVIADDEVDCRVKSSHGVLELTGVDSDDLKEQ